MTESLPGWVNGMNQADARLATGLLVTSAARDGDAGAARTGLRPAPGTPGRVSAADPGGGSGLVRVEPFQAVMEEPDVGGAFLATLEATKDVDVFAGAAPPENDPRVDLVAARLVEEGDWRFEVTAVHGEPGPDPRPPAPGAGSVPLAEITVRPEALGIEPDDIVPLWQQHPFTCAIGGVLPVRDAGARPSNPYEGLYVHRLDSGELECFHGGRWEVFRPVRDTGWHVVENLKPDYVHGEAAGVSAPLSVRRIGETVHLRGAVRKTVDDGRPWIADLTMLPEPDPEFPYPPDPHRFGMPMRRPGLRPEQPHLALVHTDRIPRRLIIHPDGRLQGARPSEEPPLPADTDQYMYTSWVTADPWPTYLDDR